MSKLFYNPTMQQTMLRIKDPKVSVPFYEKNFGMKLVHWMSFPQWKFTVYFLERQREGQPPSPECTMEKATLESEKYLNTMPGMSKGHAIIAPRIRRYSAQSPYSERCPCPVPPAAALELTHNHGTEEDPDYKIWNGNTGADAGGALFAEEPKARGFGHIAFNCDDVYGATDKLLASGVQFQKKPDEGRMKGIGRLRAVPSAPPITLPNALAHPVAAPMLTRLEPTTRSLRPRP